MLIQKGVTKNAYIERCYKECLYRKVLQRMLIQKGVTQNAYT